MLALKWPDDSNPYLIAGVRGSFEPRAPRSAGGVDVAISQSFARWGIASLPWSSCDSGSDLETPGADVVRGWAHVDLRGEADAPPSGDLPVSALLRATWDALELYGALELSGVDAVAPAELSGDAMWRRVAGSVLRDRKRVAAGSADALVAAGPDGESSWSEDAVVARLGELVPVARADGAPLADGRPAREAPFADRSSYALRLVATLPAWTVDDAAWLAEAVLVACGLAGVSGRVGVAVARRHDEAPSVD